ncbi:2-dehydro-3-deoxygalactonokinase [Pseudoalteromonas sp. MMG010]|uniref:2-dehydro-3-deoxygalactonokinase n=1 Tax=Pseudoalteromonas sp. MMG010 TaxID=2822685 RepID=UPI001B3A30D0|nr:2-dehydro-3-deoxygalactonokinase [Pseudoalteromonas sp. MMG010]MBQ4832605.1 2-dehydro-3-deoxygalactonokinase [Pseudoalteromonas sp. MMG010]
MSLKNTFIAIDWGTSHLRAYLCNTYSDKRFELIAQRDGPGVIKGKKTFSQIMEQAIAPWAHEYGTPAVLMAGQITSSIGWIETPYMKCPVNPEKLLSSALKQNSKQYAITALPGAQCVLHNTMLDVMRGEELQILGFLKQNPAYSQGKVLLCLPGTHTKWVLLEDGLIVCFKTAMTGEFYDLLCHQSVLIANDCQGGEFDWQAYEQGCNLTLGSNSGNLAHGIFSVRTRQLSKELDSVQAKAYLSGVLIGSDVRAARYATEWQLVPGSKVVVIGTEQLNRCFATALSHVGVQCDTFSVHTATLSGFNYLHHQQIASQSPL